MRPLYRFACFTAGAILLLICSGGLVTSTNSGLAVPDWPNSYGYNMFAFPWSRWSSGGVFHEHSHRLIASGVGMLTVALAAWLWLAEPRRWLKILGVIALVAVIVQGVLGGLRVIALKDEIGIFHAGLAQAFLALVCFIAFALSRTWDRLGLIAPLDAAARNRLRSIAVLVTALIYGQLILGATMRHAHAELSIRDFPLAYGQILPPLDDAFVARINAERLEVLHLPPTTKAQIILQMLHRFGALLVGIGVVVVAIVGWRSATLPASIRRVAVLWPALIAGQIVLGMYSIWTQKAADIATAHVAVGAASLVMGVMLIAMLSRLGATAPLLARQSQPTARRVEVAA
jgi:cytochrome c oxidase assembly protein subunit 15